jgi:WD40 repeat protein
MRLATISFDSVRIWDLQSFSNVLKIDAPSGLQATVALHPTSESVAATDLDDSVKTWTLAQDPLSSKPGPEIRNSRRGDDFMAIAFDETGSQLITVSQSGLVEFWDWMSAKLLREMRLAAWSRATTLMRSRSVALTSRAVAAVGIGGVIGVWKFSSGGDEHIVIPVPTATVVDTGIALSSNAEFAAVVVDTGVFFFDIEKRENVQLSDVLGRNISAIAVDPNGRRVAVAADGFRQTIVVIDVRERRIETQLNGHDDRITSMAFSPSGQKFVSADSNGRLRVWDVQRDFISGTMSTSGQQDFSISVRPPERRVQPSDAALARLEKLSTDELMAMAAQVVGHNMSCATWKRFFPMDAYRPTFPSLPGPTNCEGATVGR